MSTPHGAVPQKTYYTYMKRFKLTALCATFIMALAAASLQAQDAPKPADGGNGGNRRGGNFNPEEFRARMEERMKTALKASDDEWKVLQPLVTKVEEARRASGGGGFGGGGPGRGGQGGGNPPGGTTSGTPRPGQAETEALDAALKEDGTSPETIKAKLTAVRESRKKGAAELATAREALRKVLTVRQEAVLVRYGLLD